MSQREILTNYRDQLLYFAPTNDAASYFTDSLVYIGEHNDQGSLGLIINRTIEITTKQFFNSLGMDVKCKLSQRKLLMGGPLSPGAIFVLHDTDKEWESTMPINDKVSLSTSKDVLEDISKGNGPKNYLIALGYSGWDGQQLDAEISENAWISSSSNFEILFEMNPEDKVNGLSKLLGFNVEMISPEPGNA